MQNTYFFGINRKTVLKENNCQARTVNPTKILCKKKNKTKTFSDKKKLRTFIINRIVIKGISKKGVLQRKKRALSGSSELQEEMIFHLEQGFLY